MRTPNFAPSPLVVLIIVLTFLCQAQSQNDLEECVAALSAADINGDNRLEKNTEYVIFLNELSGDEFDSFTYEDLPSTLQANFQTYMGSDKAIDITGSKPGSYPNKQQETLFEMLCQTTDEAIAENFVFLAPEHAATEDDILELVSPGNGTEHGIHNISFRDSVLFSVMNITHNISEATNETSTNLHDYASVFTRAPVDGDFTINNNTNLTASLTNVTDHPEEQDDPNDGWEDGLANATNTSLAFTFESSSFPTTESSPAPSPGIGEATEGSTGSLFPTETSLPSPSPSAALTISHAPSEGPYSQCRMVIKFGDIDGDNYMNKKEYIWFLNDNWGNPYPGVTFENLPQHVRDNFYNFAAENGKIDIAGLGSNQQGNSTDPAAQNAFLDNFCATTDNVVAQEETGNSMTATMSIFKNCLSVVTVYDWNFDAKIDENEYLELIRNLSKEKLGTSSFQDLPKALQDNFISLAENETFIDLHGAKQGEELTGIQQESLTSICMGTSFALDMALGQLPIEEQGTTPYDTANDLTMLEYAKCFMGMRTFDINKDMGLNEEEYVELVNHLGKNDFVGLNFTGLPQLLQDNFFKFATDGEINIEGAGSNDTAKTTQQVYLQRVCAETTSAINIALGVPRPAQKPATGTPPETITIYSAFNIYSDVWISPEELAMGQTRQNLEETYRQFVRQIIDESTTTGTTAPALRRTLAENQIPLISLIRDSPNIYQIKDLKCKGSETKEVTCKTVYARYEITILDGTDTKVVYGDFVQLTQRSIDSGALQSELESIAPKSSITVVGAAEPVVFSDGNSPLPPDLSMADGTNTSDKRKVGISKKKKTISLVALAFGILAIAGLVGIVMLRYKKGLVARSNPESEVYSLASFPKASDTASNGNDEEASRAENDEENGNEELENMSSIFRSRGIGSSQHDRLSHTEMGEMEVVDIEVHDQGNVTSTRDESHGQANEYDIDCAARPVSPRNGSQHMELSSLPPLSRSKKRVSSKASKFDEMSFAFRRYALNGGKKKRDDDTLENERDSVILMS